MNAEHQASADGRRDAEFDLEHRFARRPRPGFFACLLSDRYRQTYIAAYHQTFDIGLRHREEDISRELAQNSKLISGDQVPRDQVFERGWRDGYDGQDTPPKGYSHEEVKTYERGHRSGTQHREWDLANRLRQQGRGR